MKTDTFLGTPFHQATSVRNMTTWWYSWGPYTVPDVYTNIHEEMEAIRHFVSMNEMSPLPKIKISGSDAQRFVDYLMTRKMSTMEVRQAWFTPWCNESGKVIADGVVFHTVQNEFLISGDNSYQHFNAHRAGFDVNIEDVTDDYGILALQGPNSQQVLEASTGEDWSDLKFCWLRTTKIADVELFVARQGFTGEHGYELWVKRNGTDGEKVWNAVAEAGLSFKVKPAGEYAIDIARVEAGLILVSADYAGAGPDERCAHVDVDSHREVDPFELGLGHCVHFEKPDFIGKQALLKLQKTGITRKMIGLELDNQKIVDLHLKNNTTPDVSPRVRWDALRLCCKNDPVGWATSITWSPTLNKLIGFACVEHKYADKGFELTVKWKDFWGKPMGTVPAKIVDLPFVAHKR
jgi:aminomethyltransferase